MTLVNRKLSEEPSVNESPLIPVISLKLTSADKHQLKQLIVDKGTLMGTG